MKRLYSTGSTSINHDYAVPLGPRKKRRISHTDANVQATNGSIKPNGWNGTFVKTTDPYALMRDCRSSSRYDDLLCHTELDTTNDNHRLTAQHFLWKDLLGFLVHPSIPTQAVDLKIADVATGNG